jgi:hypothetical protein
VRLTVITGNVVKEQPLLTCVECGAPTRTAAHREFIRSRMPEHMAALLDRELCPACARERADRARLTDVTGVPTTSAAADQAAPSAP